MAHELLTAARYVELRQKGIIQMLAINSGLRALFGCGLGTIALVGCLGQEPDSTEPETGKAREAQDFYYCDTWESGESCWETCCIDEPEGEPLCGEACVYDRP